MDSLLHELIMKTLKLALIGECMIELQEVSPQTTRQTFGGDTLNTAIYAARLGRELPMSVDYVTALGTDTFSDRMVRFWEEEGVGSGLVQRVDGEMPGLYYIETDEHGERIFHYWRSTAAAKRCFEYPGSETVLEQLSEYDGIYLSGISLAIFTPASRSALLERLRQLAAAGVRIYFDCNFRPHLWKSVDEAKAIYEQLYGMSEIVFLTTEEAVDLLEGAEGEAVCSRLRTLGAKEIIVKDGGDPCTIYIGDEVVVEPAQPVEKVVDTTAAGDSFSAVYLVARYFGCPPAKAAGMAHATAAYVVSHKGAVAPLGAMPVSGSDIEKCNDAGK